MTELEMPRTEQMFNESYTYKSAVFQFCNYFGALFVMMLIRGNVMLKDGSPLGDLRTDCPLAGCLLDISIQLAMILIGKQAINNAGEILWPMLTNYCRRGGPIGSANLAQHRWQRDFTLDSPEKPHLHSDYLEMWIQYGLITMFVPAFPLAPLFALINNIIELRLDAYKTLIQTKR